MKPMLACSTVVKPSDIKYPKYCSAKLDGIRCLIVDGKALTRSLKPIPNVYVRSYLEALDINNVDGELIVQGKDFNGVQSSIMSINGEPDFTYYLFDDFTNPEHPTRLRLHDLSNRDIRDERIKVLKQNFFSNAGELEDFYFMCLSAGEEGAIAKDPEGIYKFGRSTLNQEYCLKLKPKFAAEGTVIGFKELELNHNNAYTGELGQTLRSDHKEGKEKADTLGALLLSFNNVEVSVGSGFTEAYRQELWNNRDNLMGLTVTFEHLGLSAYGVPRCPIFKGFRED